VDDPRLAEGPEIAADVDLGVVEGQECVDPCDDLGSLALTNHDYKAEPNADR
jgi:hypothetical protein